MQKLKCNCPNCIGSLILQPEKSGRKNVFICSKCGCTHCLCIVQRTTKCCGIEVKKRKSEVTNHQRGRPPKKNNIEEQIKRAINPAYNIPHLRD